MTMQKFSMQFLIFMALALAALCPVQPVLAAGESPPRFFSALQDVPLMPGLHEISELTVIFDKPEGRIIESVAGIDSVPKLSVEEFYAQSLPQLGWTPLAENNFVRQDEVLSLGFESLEGRGDVLRILVQPRQ